MEGESEKPKIGIYWLGACGGCDAAIIDLGESLLEISETAEIMLWPVALDFKIERVRALPDRDLTLSIISGCIRNSEHREIAELLRAKSRLVLALGACACFGGIPGLANLSSKGDILEWVYRNAPTVTNPTCSKPERLCRVNGEELRLPKFFDHVYALNQVIEVNYFLPGCPPPIALLKKAISSLLGDKPPQQGTTLAAQKALCDSCPRNSSRPLRTEIKAILRPHEVLIDPTDCFLAHGVICLGPATRDGCGGSCLATNTPCRGCFGPVEGVQDAGVRFLSSLAPLLAPQDEHELRLLLEAIADPAGYCCRFTQATSILGVRTISKEEAQ